MITEALLHCPRVGPARLKALHALGVRSWHDVLERQQCVPTAIREGIVCESRRCLAALEANDIGYFVQHLAPQDHWRILSHFLEEVSFFDIETAGLEYHDPITVVVCWHKGEVVSFVEHENLDGFLDLLDDIQLLSSFNGSSFDVPRVLDFFHIPRLPCPHLDLRWLCYHQGMRGGLKAITSRAGIRRPVDLQHADGEWATRLWARWQHFRDAQARDELLRYCASDVLLLVALAHRLTERDSPQQLWSKLPRACSSPIHAESGTPPLQSGDVFGAGSPSQLRARRRMVS